MTPQEQWQSYFDFAGALKAAAAPSASATGIIGRSITVILNRLAKFWGDHKATLIPLLSQIAVAAMEALVANVAAFDAVNPPGPQ